MNKILKMIFLYVFFLYCDLTFNFLVYLLSDKCVYEFSLLILSSFSFPVCNINFPYFFSLYIYIYIACAFGTFFPLFTVLSSHFASSQLQFCRKFFSILLFISLSGLQCSFHSCLSIRLLMFLIFFLS